MTPEFSIIIVNYNTKQLLLNCIHSLQIKLKNGPKYEIIVLDNASTDGSPIALKKISLKNLKVIQSKINLGFAKGNNIAAKQAKGKYLFFLNSDTLIKEINLSKIAQLFEKDQHIGLIAPKLLNIDNTIQPSCYHSQNLKNAIKEYWLGQKNAFSKYTPNKKTASEVDLVVAAAIFLPTKLFWQIGGWDERYFMYFEDLELCKKLKSANKKILYVPDLQVVHLHGSSPHSQNPPSNTLVKSSKIFHGHVKYYLLYLILWTGQKKS